MMLRRGLKRTPAWGNLRTRGAEPAPSYNEHDAPWRSVPGQRVSRSLAQIARPGPGSKSPLRVEGRATITGRAEYTDPRLPGLLHGKQFRATIATAGSTRSTGAAWRGLALLTDHKMPAMSNLPVIIENWVEPDQSNGPFVAKRVRRGRNVLRFASDCRRARPWGRHSSDRSAAQSAYRASCAKAGYPSEEERT
jgi:hypothetical protein